MYRVWRRGLPAGRVDPAGGRNHYPALRSGPVEMRYAELPEQLRDRAGVLHAPGHVPGPWRAYSLLFQERLCPARQPASTSLLFSPVFFAAWFHCPGCSGQTWMYCVIFSPFVTSFEDRWAGGRRPPLLFILAYH